LLELDPSLLQVRRDDRPAAGLVCLLQCPSIVVVVVTTAARRISLSHPYLVMNLRWPVEPGRDGA